MAGVQHQGFAGQQGQFGQQQFQGQQQQFNPQQQQQFGQQQQNAQQFAQQNQQQFGQQPAQQFGQQNAQPQQFGQQNAQQFGQQNQQQFGQQANQQQFGQQSTQQQFGQQGQQQFGQQNQQQFAPQAQQQVAPQEHQQGVSMQEFIENQENNEGVRFSWNVWPNTRVEATRNVVPVGCLFTPLKRRTEDVCPPLRYDPLRCTRQQCQAILNPLCQVDFRSKLWVCCFCFQRNQFPANYASMNETNQPAELFPKFSTVEYTMVRKPPQPAIFMYVVDLCVDEEELGALKSSITNTTALLPPDSLVGLITYGKHVQVHVLASEGMRKQFVFPGDKEQTAKTVQEHLGREVSG